MQIESRQHVATLLSGLQDWDFGPEHPNAFEELCAYVYINCDRFETLKEVVADFIIARLKQNVSDYSLDRMEWA